RRRQTRFSRDWSSGVCSSDLTVHPAVGRLGDGQVEPAGTEQDEERGGDPGAAALDRAEVDDHWLGWRGHGSSRRRTPVPGWWGWTAHPGMVLESRAAAVLAHGGGGHAGAVASRSGGP